ncbi:uncharacterized protein BP5553_01388 [Venustampulla echinocandica]|uniref:F-box domain-containing protein n=1 Tax=Venustampulla echinocandica TaxID=2656787 RepID=A0A370U0U8_9HELO|nr:uncharacterized protein BP5553_01388 [Venustampulla echinocandica]RDL41409.1 hypothetical protein BP5553_01388 [Venustampulla echinocandica]
MSGHGAPSEEVPGASDARLSLDQTFNHPAGLRTARHIVEALLERAEISSGSIIHRLPGERSSQTSHALFGSNPAVMDDLKEILAFRESPFSNAGRSEVEARAGSVTLGDSRSNPRYPNKNYSASSSTLTSTSTARTILQHQGHSYAREACHRDGHAYPDTQFAVESRPPSTGPASSSLDSENTSQPHLPHHIEHQRSSDAKAEFLRSKTIGDTTEGEEESTALIRSTLSQTLRNSPTSALPSTPKTRRLSSGPASLDLPAISPSSASRPPPSSTAHHLLPPLDLASNQATRLGFNPFHTIKGFLPVNKANEASYSANKQLTQARTLSSNTLPALGTDDALRPSIMANTTVFGKQTASVAGEEATHAHLSTSNSSASPTPCHIFSQTTLDFSLSGEYQSTITKGPRKKSAPRKRKAKELLGQDIWMRILEFTPPTFLKKARLINREFKGMVDKFDSIFVNCRKENYGWDMPPPPPGMTERQYSDLLGGKGCQEPGCDNKKATRTYWSWAKRWCSDCWEHRIEREDRIFKRLSAIYSRTTLVKMLESIPIAIHDSFVKPHDYIDDVESRSRGPPRLYKCYLTDDLSEIMEEYEALTPPPYKDDPTHTPAQKSAALAAHKVLMDALDDKRSEFFAAKKAKNDEHMAKVMKIEVAIRNKRQLERIPRDKARRSRIALFTRRAQEDLPHLSVDFVQKTLSFKAACRIYRDGGTERGWRALKPKIEREWEESDQNPANGTTEDLPTSQNAATGEFESGIDEPEDFELHQADMMSMNNEQYASFRNRTEHQVLPRPNNFPNMGSGASTPGILGSVINHRNNFFGLASSHQSAFSRTTLPYPGQNLPNSHVPSSSRPSPVVASYISLFPHMNQNSSANLSGLPRPNPATLNALSTHIPVNSLLRPPTPAGGPKCFPFI